MNVPETPATIPVRLVCPECGQALQVEIEVRCQLTVITDMEDDQLVTLKPKLKSQTIAHVHNQSTLDDVLVTTSS